MQVYTSTRFLFSYSLLLTQLQNSKSTLYKDKKSIIKKTLNNKTLFNKFKDSAEKMFMYSGPKMFFQHPILGIQHICDSFKNNDQTLQFLSSSNRYTQLINTEKDDEYISRVARTIDEARQLLEIGFDYVCEIEDVKLFRKRK